MRDLQTASGAPITTQAADPGAKPTVRVLHGATSTAPAKGPFRLLLIGLAVLLYAADQSTKWLAESRLAVGQPIPVIDELLWWSLHYNPGAAFSLGTQFTIVLSVLALIVLIVLCVLVAPRVRGWLPAVAVGWLLAGVAGNLTDRLLRAPGPFRGHVVDFIAVRGFAIFNVADMCITGAAGLLIFWSFRAERR